MIKLLELRTEKGISQREVARLMQISQGTYNNWENGKTQPSIEQLIALAGLFDVSVDYLIGHTDEYGTVQTSNSLSTQERELLKNYRALSDDTKRALLAFLKTVK